jgi:trehalose/maltose transport system substrate-binding protein
MKIKYCAAFLVAIATIRVAAAEPVVITMVCDSNHSMKLCQDGADIWAKKTGNTVKVIPVPKGSEQLGIYQQFLAERSSMVDVYTIDVVWTGVLSRYLVDLSQEAGPTIDEHFPSIVKNNTVDGKLVAMPWYVDSGLLYYRKDLLQKYGEKVPTTWEELEDTARRIQDASRRDGNGKMWGFVWQGKPGEGLTCDAVEWIASYNGGTIVDQNGKVTINNPAAAKALQRARGWIGKISPQEMLKSDEEGSRAYFQAGNAVFHRNWPYAWGLANATDSPIKGLVGVGPLPRGGSDGHRAATLGGQLLAVSKSSKHVKEAIDLVMYMSGREEQKRRAIQGGYNPTIESLYKDKDVLAANPFQGELYSTFIHTTARPSTQTRARYNQVSSEFWNAVHGILSGNNDAAAGLRTLESRLQALPRGGNW